MLESLWRMRGNGTDDVFVIAPTLSAAHEKAMIHITARCATYGSDALDHRWRKQLESIELVARDAEIIR